ncbi:cytidylyltransferase domain-containing protein [Metabacillus herbersteinensis]|uniref:Cytidylyltransferase domain-containing protein n=1 Tax=Metabacillus herbersteinensis TaxID=283816 RepID=A0ABV6GE18_9BACI
MKTLIIIQARMGSTRLPGKVLKPLGESVVLDYVISRCKQVSQVEEVIVATSTLKQDDVIINWCKEHDVTCFRGSEDDVLKRYYTCAKPHNPDYIIRVTADCPFVDYHLANQINDAMKKKPADFVIVNGKLPRGLVVEMIAFSALEYMYKHGHKSRYREHVTYYAYEFPEKFNQTEVTAPCSLQHPELRITLDTKEDYQLCVAVADHFYGNKLISSQDVVDYLRAYPEIANKNSHIKQKPVE